MAIKKIQSLEEWEGMQTPIALALGMFDGVHLGHRAVLNRCIEFAKAENLTPAVLTFWPHPSHLIRPDDPTQMIQNIVHKKDLLENIGIQLLIEIEFTRSFAAIEADQFLPLLHSKIHSLKSLFVGENFRFGKKRIGDLQLLSSQGKKLGIQIHGLPRKLYKGQPISSSRIRKELADGNLSEVNFMLNRPYACSGKVITGKQLGRTIGFPTLNIAYDPEKRPRFGVYLVRVHSESDSAWGVANFGLRPTVNSETNKPLLEIHVLEDSCPWTTGKELKIDWIQFIRSEQKFASLDALKQQIKLDLEDSKKILLKMKIPPLRI